MKERKGKMVPLQEPLSELMTQIMEHSASHREAERIADERECMLYAEYSQNGVFAKKVRKEFE